MIICKWDDLPENLKNESVRKYYDQLQKKHLSLLLKRLFDIFAGIVVLVVLSPLLIIIGVIIKIDSDGPVLFRQVRITQYGKPFHILKFRSMVVNAEKIGTQITTKDDPRITSVGRYIRKFHLDELPQLVNIIIGNMSFVGTRPEVKKFVDHYTDEMMATLLLPAGVTSEASISYKNEDQLISDVENVDKFYLEKILPDKMKYNLRSIEQFNFIMDISIMARTMAVVFANNGIPKVRKLMGE